MCSFLCRFIFFQHFESDFPPIPQTLENHPPRIMVGAGSGVAPFLSMLREIDHVMAASGSASHSGGTMNSGNGEAKLPKIAAFFGFKSPNHDFLFQEQFEKWSRTAVSELVRVCVDCVCMHCASCATNLSQYFASGRQETSCRLLVLIGVDCVSPACVQGPVISYFFPVFSAAPNPAPLQDCRHVQDALLQQKELVADMLFGEGDFAGLPPSILLVCGSQDLAAGVEQSILAVVRSARPTWKPHQVWLEEEKEHLGAQCGSMDVVLALERKNFKAITCIFFCPKCRRGISFCKSCTKNAGL